MSPSWMPGNSYVCLKRGSRRIEMSSSSRCAPGISSIHRRCKSSCRRARAALTDGVSCDADVHCRPGGFHNTKKMLELLRPSRRR
eukprot:scaffold259354_cov31-Tisochrysis_lutea.AAC.1